MKVLDFIVLMFLLAALAIGVYFLWDNWPGQIQEFKGGSLVGPTSTVYSNGSQFYPNMRYPDKNINYSIASVCDAKKTQSVIDAFSLLANETALKFEQVGENGQIQILCSDIAPDATDKDHFIAGEGGPKDIFVSGQYYVITSGRVSLYRNEKCDSPKVSLHEILHALGFDHNNNPASIMFPITSCDEKLDPYIIDDINKLYSTKSAPDLVITNANAEKSGKYLSFQVEIANYGLIDAPAVNLSLYANGQKVNDFGFQDIPLGNRKEIKVNNLLIPKDTQDIKFSAYLTNGGDEISLDNNDIQLSVVNH